MVKEELDRKIKGTASSAWKIMMRDAMEKAMRDVLYKEHNIGQWQRDWIEPIIEKIVNESVRKINWKQKVGYMADEKIRKMLNDDSA